MKLVNYQESQIKVNISAQFRTGKMELTAQVTDQDEPTVLGTIDHSGFSLSETSPLVLTLTEEGIKLLSVRAPVKQEFKDAVAV